MNKDFKERLKEKLDENGIEQNDLLKFIARKMIVQDPYKFIKNNKSNFSKMLKDERGMPISYVAAIEERLNTTFDYLVNGNDNNPNFSKNGIKYAAYKDDIDFYKQLEDIIGNSDEYNKTILDYMVDFKSINGLKYLFDLNMLQFYTQNDKTNLLNMFASNMKTICESIAKILIRADEEQYFKKMYNLNHFIFYDNGFGIFNHDDVIDCILESENVFNSLLETYILKDPSVKVIDRKTGEEIKYYYYNPILKFTAKRALQKKDKYKDKLKLILQFANDFNRKSASEFYRHNENTKIKLDSEDRIMLSYQISGMIFTLNDIDFSEVSDDLKHLINDFDNQVNDLMLGNQNTLYKIGSKVFIRDKKIMKKKTNNQAEYDLLKLLEENNYGKAPKLLKSNVKNYDAFELMPGQSIKNGFYDYSDNHLKEIISELKTIKEISKKYLNNGKVYCHGNINLTNVLFNNDNKITAIISWDNTHIGEEYEDFASAYVEWSRNINSFDSYQMFIDELLDLVEVYGLDKKHIPELIDYMHEYIVKKINNIDKNISDFENSYKNYAKKKMFIEYLQLKFNDLAR